MRMWIGSLWRRTRSTYRPRSKYRMQVVAEDAVQAPILDGIKCGSPHYFDDTPRPSIG